MKRYPYHVEIWGDYVTKGTAPIAVRESLIKCLRKEGHTEVNFDISVSRIKDDMASSNIDLNNSSFTTGLDKTPEHHGIIKTASKKPQKRKHLIRSKSKPKKKVHHA